MITSEQAAKYLDAVGPELTVDLAIDYERERTLAAISRDRSAEVLSEVRINRVAVRYSETELTILTRGGVGSEDFAYAIDQCVRSFRGAVTGVGLWNYIRATALAHRASEIDRTNSAQ